MYCAMIGDIVQSKKLSSQARDALQRRLRSVLAEIATECAQEICLPFALTFGDAFEGVLFAPHKAPDIAMRILRAAAPHQVRIGIALGELSTLPENGDVHMADGPALHAAREAVETLKAERNPGGWLHLAMAAQPGALDTAALALLQGMLGLLTALTGGWTDRQRQIIWMTDEEGGQQQKVAQRLGISPASVSTSLKRGHYRAYRQAWDAWIDFLQTHTKEG